MLSSGSHSTDDLIAAIATPPGPAARAVLRLSGAEIRDCLIKIWRPATFDLAGKHLWEEGESQAHQALSAAERPVLLAGRVKIDATGRSISCNLCYWPDARSFTRAPLAEIHLLGSDPIVEALLEQACQHGARLAQGGEFTLRAFLGGRIDLTQAEAVLGVIQARSEQAFDVALRQLAGGLSEPLHALREELLNLLAEVEAGLDFADEDIPLIEDGALAERLHEALADARVQLSKLEHRDSVPLAGRVVLLGPPNAGKSSLFNCLTGGRALESPEPGTTRDYLTAPLELDGVCCELIDTAGFEFTNPRVSQGERTDRGVDTEARAVTAGQCETASLKVLCLDAAQPLGSREGETVEVHRQSGGLVVLTKCDLIENGAALMGSADVRTSSLTGEGIAALCGILRERFAEGTVASQMVVPTTASRCRESLQAVAISLKEALKVVAPHPSHELISAEIRNALDALGQVTGAIYTEDMLDRVFARFCIGK